MATYVCNAGFGLNGRDTTSACGGDDSSSAGMWSGTPPTCEGMTYVCAHNFTQTIKEIVLMRQPLY